MLAMDYSIQGVIQIIWNFVNGKFAIEFQYAN